jgi:hypothetical protein
MPDWLKGNGSAGSSNSEIDQLTNTINEQLCYGKVA